MPKMRKEHSVPYAAVKQFVEDHPQATGQHIVDRWPDTNIYRARKHVARARIELGLPTPDRKSWKAKPAPKAAPKEPKPLRSPKDTEPSTREPREREAPKPYDGRTPVIQMSHDDRETVVSTVRDIYSTLRIASKRILESVLADAKAKEVLTLDKDTTQAMQQLQKTAAGLVDMHPGLLALTESTGSSKVTDDDLSIVYGLLEKLTPAAMAE